MTDGAAFPPRPFHVAKLVECRTMRGGLVHAVRAQLAAAHREMEVELGVDFFVDAGTAKPEREAVAEVHRPY
jgi:hypothetical protein